MNGNEYYLKPEDYRLLEEAVSDLLFSSDDAFLDHVEATVATLRARRFREVSE